MYPVEQFNLSEKLKLLCTYGLMTYICRFRHLESALAFLSNGAVINHNLILGSTYLTLHCSSFFFLLRACFIIYGAVTVTFSKLISCYCLTLRPRYADDSPPHPCKFPQDYLPPFQKRSYRRVPPLGEFPRRISRLRTPLKKNSSKEKFLKLKVA